jgi:23S rRNA (cytidine1920-2'-O)/16S rRNA (cytidine1409-2'-O)-methyltransferase
MFSWRWRWKTMPKIRLDALLVARGLAEQPDQARRLAMAGQVRVDGQLVIDPATPVRSEAQLQVERGPRFVSRGGEKLQAALQAFQIRVVDRVCADVGASTGGFTDCLLQAGASRVYAIDVGRGILHWKLRQDGRVVVCEGTNARYLERLPEPVSLVTLDASFISLKLLLPVVCGWLRDQGEAIALVKPQFEAGRRASARAAGVIRDPEIHRQVLQDLLAFAQGLGLQAGGLIRSPLRGPKGNIEFLAWLRREVGAAKEHSHLVDSALNQAPE